MNLPLSQETSVKPVADFLAAMTAAGLAPADPREIVADGRLHRYQVAGDKPGRRNGWMVLHLDGPAAGAFGSWKDGQTHTWRAGRSAPESVAERQALRRRIREERRRREAEDARRRVETAERVRRLWGETRPLGGTAAATYLHARGITLPPPPTLRYHPGLLHKETSLRLPAMVAAVTVWPAREVTAIHRTFLNADGSGKASVTTPKLSLGPVKGGAVRLGPVGDELVVAEGIETALAVMAATGIPAWAALSAGGMEAVRLPERVARLIIAADNDASGRGQEAAERLAERAIQEGREVRIALPPETGADFNDLLQGAA